jgi:predicted AAA+ superfamily ATPase
MDVIRVVDVPDGTPADEAQKLLNEPCSENRYLLVQVLPLPGGATRAFYRLLRNAYHPDSPHRQSFTNLDGKDDAARAIISAHGQRLTIPALMRALADTGIKRGKTWVSERRLELCGRRSAKH